jgi:uncharacterized membrane protein
MTAKLVRFALLLLLGLLVGTMFGIWVGYDPSALSASAYVEQQQNAIRSLNTLLPVIGAACIALTVWLAILAKGDARARYLLVAAVVCLLTAALVTRFGNQPINAVVMTWNPGSPPPEWTQLRDTWWRWHIVRASAGMVGFGLALLAVLGARTAPTPNPGAI